MSGLKHAYALLQLTRDQFNFTVFSCIVVSLLLSRFGAVPSLCLRRFIFCARWNFRNRWSSYERHMPDVLEPSIGMHLVARVQLDESRQQALEARETASQAQAVCPFS